MNRDYEGISGSPEVNKNLTMRESLDRQTNKKLIRRASLVHQNNRDTIQATLIARPLPATHRAASPPRGCHATLAVTSLHTVR